MEVVKIQVPHPALADKWLSLEPWLTAGVPPASITSDGPPREVYLFGFHEGEAGVWRSEGGADIIRGIAREVLTVGLERLSDLSEPYELKINKGAVTFSKVRFVKEIEE